MHGKLTHRTYVYICQKYLRVLQVCAPCILYAYNVHVCGGQIFRFLKGLFRNRRTQEWNGPVIRFYFIYVSVYSLARLANSWLDLFPHREPFEIFPSSSLFIITSTSAVVDLLLFTRDTRGAVSKDLKKKKKQTLLVPLSPSQVFLLAAHKF